MLTMGIEEDDLKKAWEVTSWERCWEFFYWFQQSWDDVPVIQFGLC